MPDLLGGIFGGFVALVLFLVIVAFLRSLIRVCPSNHILVVTGGTETVVDGRKYGFRLQKGGWTFVIPFIQSVQAIDLTIIPINVRVEGVNSANGISVGADATACVCIDDQKETLLYSAVQQLLGKSRGQIQEQIQQTMIGNFRAALNKTTPLQAIGMVESAEGVDEVELSELAGKTIGTSPLDPDGNRYQEKMSEQEGERAIFRSVLLEDCQEDLSTFGIEVVSVSLQRIWDSSNYIANLANKTLSRKRKEVEIEEARLRSRAERAESDAKRRELVAENRANERIVAARQEVELFQRQCAADIHRAKLEADSAVAEAESQGQRKVEEMKVDLQRLRNLSEVTLDANAKRRAAEILAKGEAEATQIVLQAHNDLLGQKVELLKRHGDVGQLVLFLDQLPTLFETYQRHAQSQIVDELLVLNEDEGFNRAVNRGPAAMVDFLHQLETGFGINVRQLMAATNSAGERSE
ncbi:MAG: hypothetical protein H3C34_04725 [Caldilineaceae bacterium]|nr:hypothetical protein [Caldilineaceae bacterium]